MLTFPVDARQSDVYKRPRVTIDTTDMPDVTRQEFKDEADINILLSRFGVNGLGQQRQVMYGDFDYDTDLQTALNAMEQAQRGYERLPADMKKKYPDWQSVILALADGEKIDEIREFLKASRTSNKENDDAPRSDPEGSSKGTDVKPAASEGRGTVPKPDDQRAT